MPVLKYKDSATGEFKKFPFVISGGASGGGGITREKYLTNGQISTKSSYASCDLNKELDVSKYDFLLFTLYAENQAYATLTSSTLGTIYLNSNYGANSIKCELTSTTLRSTYYSGNYQEMFVDIEAIKFGSGGGDTPTLPDYSFEPHKTGRKWFDGKDIWEVTIDIGIDRISTSYSSRLMDDIFNSLKLLRPIKGFVTSDDYLVSVGARFIFIDNKWYLSSDMELGYGYRKYLTLEYTRNDEPSKAYEFNVGSGFGYVDVNVREGLVKDGVFTPSEDFANYRYTGTNTGSHGDLSWRYVDGGKWYFSTSNSFGLSISTDLQTAEYYAKDTEYYIYYTDTVTKYGIIGGL